MRIILAILAILIAVPVGLGVIGMFNSVATAPSRVATKTLGTNNIISNYEEFFDRQAQYSSRVAQIEGHRAIIAATADPKELSRLRMELVAMQQSCREIANTYNNDAQKMNVGIFRDADLPERLDATQCEETK